MRGQEVTVNDKKYRLICILNMLRKFPNRENLGIQLEISVYSQDEKRYILWNEIKDSYLAEKISEFAENSFNGQNSFYWSNESEENDD